MMCRSVFSLTTPVVCSPFWMFSTPATTSYCGGGVQFILAADSAMPSVARSLCRTEQASLPLRAYTAGATAMQCLSGLLLPHLQGPSSDMFAFTGSCQRAGCFFWQVNNGVLSLTQITHMYLPSIAMLPGVVVCERGELPYIFCHSLLWKISHWLTFFYIDCLPAVKNNAVREWPSAIRMHYSAVCSRL